MTVYLFFMFFSSSICLFYLRVFISLITLFICSYMLSTLSIITLNMSHNYLNFLFDHCKMYVLSESGSDNCFVSLDILSCNILCNFCVKARHYVSGCRTWGINKLLVWDFIFIWLRSWAVFNVCSSYTLQRLHFL